MFSVSTSVVLLVFFVSQGQSTTTLGPEAIVTPSTMPHQASSAATSKTMTPMTTSPQTVTIVSSAQTSTRESTTPMVPPPSSASSLSTSASIAPQEKPSCVLVTFIAERPWNTSLSESMSVLYNKTSEEISNAVMHFFNESSKYGDVEVSEHKYSEHKYSEEDSVTFVKIKLCLVVKTSDGPFVDAVFIDKLKTGYLFEGFKVKKDSAKFEPQGVEFKDWKAKDDECTKCEGAGGEFTIERTCVPKESSCKGVKNTMMTNDCVTYCDSSAGTYAVSFLILAMGIFFSFSFQ